MCACGFTMAAACACPYETGGRVSHSWFERLEGCLRAAVMRPRSVLLPSLHWGELRSRLLPDSQSGITSRKCGLRGRPTAGIGRSRRAGVLHSLAPIRSVARHEAPPLLFLSLFFLKACCVQLYTLLLLKPLFLQCNNNEEGKHVCLKKKVSLTNLTWTFTLITA